MPSIRSVERDTKASRPPPRHAGPNAAIRAVAITARADEESRARAERSGFDEYIPKLVSALVVPTVARLRRPR